MSKKPHVITSDDLVDDSGVLIKALQDGFVTDDIRGPSPARGGDIAQAVVGQFNFSQGILSVFGDALGNSIVINRNAAGAILVNGGAVSTPGGQPTVANTSLIQVFGQGGNDTIELNEANGALPRGNLFGGAGNDSITGGSGADMLFGQSGNDTLLGKGGNDFLFGGSENDVLVGGDGDDQMFGESGNDRMIWNPGDDSDLMEGGDGTDTAEVNGGNGAEQFTLTANGTRVRFDRISPAPFALDIGTTESIVVNMNGGNDTFSATGNLAALINVTVDGGAGNDTILSSNGNDRLLGGDGDDFIDGQQGNDTIFLGAGNDVFQWDPGDGSDIVEGQDGFDTMVFNGSNIGENIDIAANGGRTQVLRNVGTISMDLDDVERINFNALGGADNITVNDMSGTDVTEVNINLAGAGGAGDGQPDTIFINATQGDDVIMVVGDGNSVSVLGLAAQINITGFDPTMDRIVINGLDGDDVVEASGLGAGSIQLTANGGNGNDVLIGGDGNDVLNGGAGDDVLIGGPGLDVLDGAEGDDIEIQLVSNDPVTTKSTGGGASFEWLMDPVRGVCCDLPYDLADDQMMMGDEKPQFGEYLA
jgi:Ca2+-binding RTX toxin-like protein